MDKIMECLGESIADGLDGTIVSEEEHLGRWGCGYVPGASTLLPALVLDVYWYGPEGELRRFRGTFVEVPIEGQADGG